ncbi:hypothetical protein O4G98_12465 [Zoogloeaceae bacterium G21618-S1]|nr:hypothetical protein [Zoogloeaceae bacterium G21618-S1]
MIIWGSGGGGKDLGQIELRNCPTCEKTRPFHLYIQYKYAHLYYLRWVTSRKYHLACDVCHRGVELETKAVEAKLEKDPIPFMTRFGWTFLVGLVAIGVLAINVGKH